MATAWITVRNCAFSNHAFMSQYNSKESIFRLQNKFGQLHDGIDCSWIENIYSKFQVRIFTNNRDRSKANVWHTKTNDTRVMTIPPLFVPKHTS